MGLTSRLAKAVSKSPAEPTSTEDFKTLKTLLRKAELARAVERKAESTAKNSVEKQKVKEAEDAIDAFNEESRARRERRIQELTSGNTTNLAKGGMAKKKLVKSSSNALNKFYGK